MKRIIEFLKSNTLVIKWTVYYFAFLYFILRFLFNFDMFSGRYWWKFFHSSLHGFGGFVFNILIYSAIPIYIATVATVHRTQTPIITIPLIDKIFSFLGKIFTPTKEETPVETSENESETTETNEATEQYPAELPSELRVPYSRARQHLSFLGNTSVFNKQKNDSIKKDEIPENPEESAFPIPSSFDITDEIPDDSIPTFTDINFDETNDEENELNNTTTKYFKEKNIEFETYKEYVATEKYLIYDHDDQDFWVMDEDNWFASGKQKDSPIKEMKQIATDNNLIPILYLEAQNIMDIENTINQIESIGVHVIKSLDELN